MEETDHITQPRTAHDSFAILRRCIIHHYNEVNQYRATLAMGEFDRLYLAADGLAKWSNHLFASACPAAREWISAGAPSLPLPTLNPHHEGPRS